MKKISLLLFLAAIVTLYSCKKDDTPLGPPTINLIGGEGFIDSDATISTGTTFKMGIATQSNTETGEKLSTLRLTRTINGAMFIDTTYTINESLYNATYTFNGQTAGISEEIEYVLTDKAGQEASISVRITYQSTALTVTKSTNILMGSHNDDNGSFYSTINNLVYNINDATLHQSDIDFLFYLGSTNASTIASPADTDANTVYNIANWTIKNETLFATSDITAADFNSIETAYVFPEFSSDLSAITKLNNGDVIMFKTINEKLGLIKINQINGRGDHVSVDVIVSE